MQSKKLSKKETDNPTTDMDYLPPNCSDSEKAVLACILLDPIPCMATCQEVFGDSLDQFYDLRHQMIYRSMCDVYSKGVTLDLPELVRSLKERKCLDEVGGIGEIAMLPDVVTTAHDLRYHLDTVLKKKQMRSVLRVCVEFQITAASANGNADSVLEQFEKAALGIRITQPDQSPPIRELVKQVIDDIEACHQRGGQIDGIPTGFVDLDRMTGGLHGGEMTVVAGYPGAGKTAIAINIVEHVSVNSKLPVGVFSMEMTAKSLVSRMVLSRARVNLRNVRNGFLADRDFPKLASASSNIASAPVYLDDTSDLSIMQLRSRARRMVQRYGIKLFVIDYIQLLNAQGAQRQVENRQQEVTDISRGIKAMAKEFQVPVIALSQLNDDGKLRESRAIGQDADGVWVLEQESTDGDEPEEARPIKLVIRKQRNGPAPCRVDLVFLKTFTRFESTAKVARTDIPQIPKERRYNDD